MKTDRSVPKSRFRFSLRQLLIVVTMFGGAKHYDPVTRSMLEFGRILLTHRRLIERTPSSVSSPGSSALRGAANFAPAV
jgi:hypothetical protein